MVRLFSKSRRSCNPCKSEIIKATQTAVDVSAQAENKVSNLQEDVIVNTGAIAGNKVTAETALTQAGDALVTAQQARQTADNVSAVADNAITIATDAQSAVEAVEDELTAIQAKNTQQDTDIRDLQQDYIDTDAHLTAVETDLEGHETNYNNPHRVTAAQLGLGSALNYKGQVQNYADLPTTGNVKGDTWNVVNAYNSYPAHSNVIWDGSQWDNTGGTIDFSGIQTRIDTLSGTVASNKTAVDTEINGIKTLNTTQTQQITALQTGKQDKLTAGSGIAISNGVITATGYSGEVDTALSTTSTNPVTNKAITEAINSKQAVGNYALKSEVTAVASDLAELQSDVSSNFNIAFNEIYPLKNTVNRLESELQQTDSKVSLINDALAGKQDKLTFDTAPTADSSNPVTSNGVYQALQGAAKEWEVFAGNLSTLITSNAFNRDVKLGVFLIRNSVSSSIYAYNELTLFKGSKISESGAFEMGLSATVSIRLYATLFYSNQTVAAAITYNFYNRTIDESIGYTRITDLNSFFNNASEDYQHRFVVWVKN